VIDLLVLLCGLIGAVGERPPENPVLRDVRGAAAKRARLAETLERSTRATTLHYDGGVTAAVMLANLKDDIEVSGAGDLAGVIDLAEAPLDFRSAIYQALIVMRRIGAARPLKAKRYGITYEGHSLLNSLASEAPATTLNPASPDPSDEPPPGAAWQ